MRKGMRGRHLIEEARDIVNSLVLLEAAGDFGDARAMGSVALDLLVQRDIDIHVLPAHPIDLTASALSLAPHLLDRDGVSEVRISDDRHQRAVQVA